MGGWINVVPHWELLQVSDNKRTPSRRAAVALNALLVYKLPKKHNYTRRDSKTAILISPRLRSIIMSHDAEPQCAEPQGGQMWKQSGGDDEV